MTFRNRQPTRAGVNLAQRTAEIERLAVAGLYHYEIAARLKVSTSTIESTMKLLREQGRVGSMRGPRKNVVGVDWERASQLWSDPGLTTEAAVEAIGCAERTIYRRLGPRAIPEPLRPPRKPRRLAPPKSEAVSPPTITLPTSPVANLLDGLERQLIAMQASAEEVRGIVQELRTVAKEELRAVAAAPRPRPKPKPFTMSAMQGRDPLRELRTQAIIEASRGRL